MQNESLKNSEAVLTLTREFDAPRELVFNAFAEAEALAEWWGPVGYKMTITQLDFKPQGKCIFKMENGADVMWARLLFGKIIKPELIEITVSFSNEEGGITRAPFFDSWPLEILNVFTLTEKAGKTTITTKSYPVNAVEAEVVSFNQNRSSFKGGLTASLEKLEQYLSRQ
jgi:uncharacterized protein YndB with AHSA1/START domain